MMPLDSVCMAAGVYRHTLLERVVHGLPFEQAVANEVQVCAAKRVLVIASPRAQDSEALVRLRSALAERCVGTWCGAQPHVPIACVQEAAVLASQLQADHLVALGGGSVIDTAKAVALLLHTGTPMQAMRLMAQQEVGFVDPSCHSQHSQSSAAWLRITAVPQTLSAAEFTWFAGVTDPVCKRKNLVAAAAIAPRCVVLDPALTQALDLPVFLASGIKAIDHALERLVALSHHPMSDALSLHALRMLSHALPVVHSRPDDLQARLQCQQAAWLSIAGVSSGVKTGASHALGHAVGAYTGVQHGLTSCVLLAAVMRWNASHNQTRQSQVLSALGACATDLASWLEQLVRSLGLPTRLRALGIAAGDLPEIAQQSLHDPGMRYNPRPVHSAADALEILQAAW